MDMSSNIPQKALPNARIAATALPKKLLRSNREAHHRETPKPNSRKKKPR
jgi:hypothetical protein